MHRAYCLISPCRNEARFLRRTLDSVLSQSELPQKWIIIDDGSTDETGEILRDYAARFPLIQVVSRPDRGARAVGGGVIEAFNSGLKQIDLDDFDYICKLDMDLDLPPTYFASLMDRMEAQPTLGTCSGKAYYPGPDNVDKSFAGTLISEGIGDDMSVGAAKFYRVKCFREIGGFIQQVMWDGIDCHRCRMNGWGAVSWDDPELRFIHLRPMGSSQQGILTGRMRHGFGQYFMGTSLLYMTLSAVFRMSHRPLVIGGAAMWWGYVRSWLKGLDRYQNLEFRRFLRRYHWLCLTRGKKRAVELVQAQARAFVATQVKAPKAKRDVLVRSE
ncbi:MAG: glycosyltransferase family 2 protein [Planctomycetales bacterium]|nr:glycosyltransferase family 2 protein [Planctomycetales bacterium]